MRSRPYLSQTVELLPPDLVHLPGSYQLPPPKLKVPLHQPSRKYFAMLRGQMSVAAPRCSPHRREIRTSVRSPFSEADNTNSAPQPTSRPELACSRSCPYPHSSTPRDRPAWHLPSSQ